MMKKENLKDIYPLSPLQEGMLYHALFDEATTAYVEQFSYRVAGPFDVDIFKHSWSDLVARHDILRTAFVYEKTARPRQIVLKQVDAQFACVDMRDSSPQQQEAHLEQLREEDRQRPFDPGAGRLARMTVVRLGPQSHEVLRSHHHILMDGWSSGILLKELMETYRARVAGVSPDLGAAIPITDYVTWVEAQDKQAAQDYWQEHLQGALSSSLPFARSSPRPGDYQAQQVNVTLDADETEVLEGLARDCRVTLGALCRAIWGILLGRYNNSTDVLFGAVVTGRPHEVANVEAMVGLFINTVPVRVRLGEDETFAALVARLQADSLAGGERQYLPLSDILGSGRRIDHLFAFENFLQDEDFGEAMQSGAYGLQIERVLRFEHTHYDFTVAVNPGRCLGVSFSFNGRMYEDHQVQRIAGHFQQVVRAVLQDHDVLVSDIDILPACERKLVLDDFNNTAAQFPREHTLDEMFRAQVAKTPENPAVVYDGRVTSYRKLNAQANALASTLSKDYGVGHGDMVAVLLGRSDSLILSFMAILKVGAVYVPIDLDYPGERVAFIIEDCGAKVTLSDSAGARLLPAQSPCLILDGIDNIDQQAEEPAAVTTPESLAYVTYTSGSTGRPNGVMLEHRGALNLATWHQKFFGLDDNSRGTLFSSPAFDASIMESLPYILCGAALYPLDNDTRFDTELLIGFYQKHAITNAFIPPTLFQEVSRTHKGRLSGGLQVWTGGDVVRDAGSGDIDVSNFYGPTECTVTATAILLDDGHRDTEISIGKPIANTFVYLLDGEMRPVPVGVAGEIHIGGAGVARGYLNRQELTSKRFLANPFRPGERLYKTGDMAKWGADGQVYFLGRNDSQIKIRGYRVELGEVENQLQNQPAIAQAAVKALKGEDGEIELVGYYVVEEEIAEAELRDQLRATMPGYMIPGRLIVVARMPLTIRGKIDRDALPDPETARADDTVSFVPPQDPHQQALADIWQEVLGLDKVGIHEDFFRAGGHSLSATRVMSRIRGRFQIELPFAALFDNPTIAHLARAVEQAEKTSCVPVRPAITPSARRRRSSSP
jgi:amino acid adenylation domain-containing protein